MLGNFLEISIQTTDILASLDFYSRLGFERAPVNDVWAHPYAVVTDGYAYLGLHQYSFPSPALTFVQPDLCRQVAEFETLGIKFEFCKLGEDRFNEAGFYDPDRQMITLLEARTCSPVNAKVSSPVCGYFDEYRLPVRNLQASCRFWERLGLISSGPDLTQPKMVRFATGGLNLGLQESGSGAQPLIVYRHARPEDLAEQLLRFNVPFDTAKLSRATGLTLTAPEGTRLVIDGGDS
jgi:catechol 2,3-dioxygenase-like lactoylglutathione lyase family enzyme